MIDALESGVHAVGKLHKADLHSHLLLSAPFEVYQEISSRRLIPPPQRYRNFAQFQAYLQSEILPLFVSTREVEIVVGAAIAQMDSDGVIYAETSVPVTVAKRIDSSWGELGEVIKRECSRHPRVRVVLELGLYRELHYSECRQEVEQALESGAFGGVDLFGDELAREIDSFLPFFEQARELGLYVKLHTGESGGGSRAFSEIKKARPNSIQHGISLAGESSALAFAKEQRISFNVCPASNIALSLIENYEAHPIKAIVDAGVTVTMGTDDFALFGRTLSQEYLALYEAKTLSAEQLEKIRVDSLMGGSLR